MNVVEKIEQISIDFANKDDNFIKLSEALEEYHRLIDEGKLIPRENRISINYSPCSFKSNL